MFPNLTNSSDDVQEVTLPRKCFQGHLRSNYQEDVLTFFHTLAPGPLLSLVIHIEKYICIAKDKTLIPQRGGFHWAPPNSLLPG